MIWSDFHSLTQCSTKSDGLIPVAGSFAISVISLPKVHAPIGVPAPVHGSQVRDGSSTTEGAVIMSSRQGSTRAQKPPAQSTVTGTPTTRSVGRSSLIFLNPLSSRPEKMGLELLRWTSL